MDHFRFVFLAMTLFVLAFAGFSWMSKGRAPAERPGAAAVAPALPPAHSTGHDAGRNLMRLTAIQASNAYLRNPCDEAARAALVVAAASYIRAAAPERDAAGAEAQSAAERNAMAAIRAAFAAGGIGADELPPMAGSQLTADGLTASGPGPAAPCAGGRRADMARD